MIEVRMPTPEGQRLVQALLIAAGSAPRPTNADDRQAYQDLADAVGKQLADAVQARPRENAPALAGPPSSR